MKYKFHVSLAPYHSRYNPYKDEFYGPANASYAMLNEQGEAVAIIDFDEGEIHRVLYGKLSEEERLEFLKMAKAHFCNAPRINA